MRVNKRSTMSLERLELRFVVLLIVSGTFYEAIAKLNSVLGNARCKRRLYGYVIEV